MPKVYIVENPQPNAFATGRDPEHAAVCVTTGLLARVNDEELAGVLAHELGHVKNHDTLTMTIDGDHRRRRLDAGQFRLLLRRTAATAIRSGLIGMLLVTLLAPIAAMLVQMTISRTREFEADRASAEITGRPLWLASALHDIDRAPRKSTIPKPTPIPRRRICSSSIRCMAALRDCSRAIHRPRNASRG